MEKVDTPRLDMAEEIIEMLAKAPPTIGWAIMIRQEIVKRFIHFEELGYEKAKVSMAQILKKHRDKLPHDSPTHQYGCALDDIGADLLKMASEPLWPSERKTS